MTQTAVAAVDLSLKCKLSNTSLIRFGKIYQSEPQLNKHYVADNFLTLNVT
jgi:hypothetical protein